MRTHEPFKEYQGRIIPEDVNPPESQYPHEWRNVIGAAARKRYGHDRIRKCVKCGAIERADVNNLRKAFHVGNLVSYQPINCDPWHRAIARLCHLKYLPYKLNREFTAEELDAAQLNPEPAKEEAQP
jgi:hypothetical protein